MPNDFSIELHKKDIIDVINFLDQKNIFVNFDKDDVFSDLINSKNFNEIEFFIDRGEKIEKFIELCDLDDFTTINFLLEKINEEEFNDILPYLINTLHPDTLEYFFSNCIEEDKLLDFSETHSDMAFTEAVKRNDLDIVKILINYGFKIKNCSNDPICMTIKRGNIEMTKFLLKNGSCLDAILPDHLTHCLKNNVFSSVDYIKNKLYKNKLAHFNNYDTLPCFLAAIIKKNLSIIIALITSGVDVSEFIDQLIISSNETFAPTTISNFLSMLKRTKPKDKVFVMTNDVFTVDFD